MSEQQEPKVNSPDEGQSRSTVGLGTEQSINDTVPVCPHCGYKHDDAWEWNFGAGLEGDSNGRECYICGGIFDCERVVDVSYTTRVPNEQAQGAVGGLIAGGSPGATGCALRHPE